MLLITSWQEWKHTATRGRRKLRRWIRCKWRRNALSNQASTRKPRWPPSTTRDSSRSSNSNNSTHRSNQSIWGQKKGPTTKTSLALFTVSRYRGTRLQTQKLRRPWSMRKSGEPCNSKYSTTEACRMETSQWLPRSISVSVRVRNPVLPTITKQSLSLLSPKLLSLL